jgi:hypothetical protein
MPPAPLLTSAGKRREIPARFRDAQKMEADIMKLAKFVTIFLVVFAILGAARAYPAEGGKYALIIGINEYKTFGSTFGNLEGCGNDVRLIRDLLTSPRFGFAPEDVTVLTDEQATHEGILAAIAEMAEKIGPDDTAYIHYSGHGSTKADKNGDEKDETGEDSTLVSYGARSGSFGADEGRGAPASLNDSDILDDELDIALSRLSAKTRSVVFVADACHSGTITRGDDIMPTRGIEADPRPHPAEGNAPLAAGAPRSWVAVGAAQVDEKAREYKADDNQKYGAFTWFWAKALESSDGGDTWQMVFERASVMMHDAGITQQNPSLEGDGRLQIFGGRVGEVPRKFTVAKTSPAITINVGSFAGVSEGSEFQVQKGGELTGARLVVQKAEPYTCEVKAEGGGVAVGDVVLLTKWKPPFPALKVAVRADYSRDEPLAAQLRGLIASDDRLAAYELAEKPDESQMLLLVTRPKKGADGKLIPEGEGALIPQLDETAAPEVWILDPSQSSFYNGLDDLRKPFDDDGLSVVTRNMERFARLYALYNMPVPRGDAAAGLEIEYLLFTRASDEEYEALSDDQRVKLDGLDAPAGAPLKWKLSRIVPAGGAGEVERNPDEGILLVRAKNPTDTPYYVYAINATPDAHILPFLPGFQTTLTIVNPHQSRAFQDILLFTDEREYVRVIATLQRINVHILAQSSVERERRTGGEKGESNPIEDMFSNTLYRSRGAPARTTLAPAEMTTTGMSFVTK